MAEGPDPAEAASANMPPGWMAGPDIAHGGQRATFARRYPDAPRPLIDLSTGINPWAYPIGELPPESLTRLPDPEDIERLQAVAARAYGVASPEMVVAAPGTQILISLLPHLLPGRAGEVVAIVSPTYGEHARSWANAGRRVNEVASPDQAGEAGIVVVCNPNNPDGRRYAADGLRDLADRLAARGALLIVDEAFADFEPAGVSMGPALPHPGVVVLRSFGKTYGLAGIRLGFLLASPAITRLARGALGPWAVSGPAVFAGLLALADAEWRKGIAARLSSATARLDALASAAGLRAAGGTLLFRLYESPRAPDVLDHLGRQGIMARGFAGDATRLRLGIPGAPPEWARLETALADVR